MFIVIENQDGDSEAWLVDTGEACIEAAARLRELGIDYAEVWAGEDDDIVKTGTRIFAE